MLKYNNLGLSRNVSFCIPNIVDGAKTVAILFDPVLLSEIEVLKTAGGLGGFEFARLGRDTPRPLDYGLLSFQDQPAEGSSSPRGPAHPRRRRRRRKLARNISPSWKIVCF